MKLDKVLKGHTTDRNVIVKWCDYCAEWNGEGIERMIRWYMPFMLDLNVVNTTKDHRGWTIIECRS